MTNIIRNIQKYKANLTLLLYTACSSGNPKTPFSQKNTTRQTKNTKINQLDAIIGTHTFSHLPPPSRDSFNANLKNKKGYRFLGDKTMEQWKNPGKYTCTCENVQRYIQIRGKNLPIYQQHWSQSTEHKQEGENRDPSTNTTIELKFKRTMQILREGCSF
jgi:hypothetical protein